MKKTTLFLNVFIFLALTSMFIYSTIIENTSSSKKFLIVFASILSIMYSMLLFFTLSFFIVIKLKSYDHIERWIRDLKRFGLISNLRLYDVMKKEISSDEFKIENLSTFFLFMKGQHPKKKLTKDFNRKIVLESILNFEHSLKKGFKINKNETLKKRLKSHKINLDQKEFNKFVLYFLFENFTKHGKYIETNNTFNKYINKIT